MTSRKGKSGNLQGFLTAFQPFTGGESFKAPSQDKEAHTDSHLSRRKRKKSSEAEVEKTKPPPRTSTIAISRPPMAGSFSFKPQFLLEKDQKVPLYASLFAEKLILGLSRTFTTTAILPKDRSVISKLSNLDHFNIVCDSIEKLKVAVVGQFKADVATSGIFRRENNTLKDFLARERKHFGHLTNQLDAAEKAKKELWYALREKEEKLKKVEFDRDEKAEKLNKMEADYEEKLKLITEYEAEGNTLVAQMEFCVNVMKSFTPYLPQKLIDQYHLGSENEKEDAPEDSGNEVIEIVPPSDSVTKNHPFLRPKLWILIFDKRVLNLM